VLYSLSLSAWRSSCFRSGADGSCGIGKGRRTVLRCRTGYIDGAKGIRPREVRSVQASHAGNGTEGR
jgi:hypothetical protein